MSDVSITDMIARLRYEYESTNPYADAAVASVMRLAAVALENAQRTLEMDEKYINKLEAKVFVLESVTAPTKGEREVLVEWRNEMHEVLENPEHLVPLEMVIDRLDAILARFRLPVPVEHSTGEVEVTS